MNYLTAVFNLLLIFNSINYGLSADSGVCYPPLGCFNITDDFKNSPVYRPINLLPQSPDRLSTHILFFSRKSSAKYGHNVDKKWISSDKISDKLVNFDGSKETKFIIHGFMETRGTAKWMFDMKNELLKKGDYNVFVVDWSEWNGMPYSQASANCRVVGAQLALLIKNLNTSDKLKYNQVHLIGHSLGAHLSGYTGKQTKEQYSAKIGRITGLDPAEPYFQYMPITVRLDKSDAEFVDIIHTDTKSILQLGYGMSQAVGHIDFYPNGGNEQPGCTQTTVASLLSGSFMRSDRAGELIACNHLRAVDYFHESINGLRSGCQFTGYACESWTIFNSRNRCNTCGKTGSFCSSMGLNAIEWKKFKSNKKSKRFYLKTDSEKPYCVFQMKIEIPIDSVGEDVTQFTGNIRIKMISGSNTTSSNFNDLTLSSNNSYSFVITLRDKTIFSSIDSIDFEWFEMTFDVFNPSTWKFTIFNQDNREQDNKIAKKELIVKHINIRSLYPGQKVKKFCNKNANTGIKPDKLVKFNKNC